MSIPIIQTHLIPYFRSVIAEVKKVSWPNRQETINKTTIVVVSSLIVGLTLGAFDFLFTRFTAFLVQ